MTKALAPIYEEEQSFHKILILHKCSLSYITKTYSKCPFWEPRFGS